jgi:glutathione S-transferase
MALLLLIGNKNYSSWSLRPWIAMKVAGIPFEERLVPLNADDFKERVADVSATGKVPALADGDTHVWESLAILEYLAERFPRARLWPDPAPARAHARAIAAEMHAGFAALRRHYPMNVRRPIKPRDPTAEAQDDIRRIDALWTDCRKRFGDGGPFLFGAFGAADAMYAPVVSRFQTYAIAPGPQARAYMDAMLSLPAWTEWRTAAEKEPWVLPHDEVD